MVSEGGADKEDKEEKGGQELAGNEANEIYPVKAQRSGLQWHLGHQHGHHDCFPALFLWYLIIYITAPP